MITSDEEPSGRPTEGTTDRILKVCENASAEYIRNERIDNIFQEHFNMKRCLHRICTKMSIA